MANIVLPRVDILDSIKESANILVEQDGSIKRFAVADLDVGGGDITVDLSNESIGASANPINADTLGGQLPEHYATTEMVNSITPENIGAVNQSSVVNNFTTTEEGFVADARALKALNDNLEAFRFISNHIFPVDNSGSSSEKTVKISSESCTFFAFTGGGSIFSASVSWNSDIGALDLTGTEDIYGTSGIEASYSNEVTTLTIPAWTTCLIITTNSGTLVG